MQICRRDTLNLLSNAIKYNRPDGRIVIDCACIEAGVCELRVTDSGAGLTASQIERLFQPFERLEASHTSIQGTGIGLSVSRRLMELMGGEIGATSKRGEGSTFWLRLRSVAADAAADMRGAAVVLPLPHAAPGPGEGNTPLLKVLYVEDNPANQRLMQRILAHRRDLELITTADPREALALAQREQPALIVLDIQLPELDGYQLLDMLRAEGIAVPVVAVSANAMPADVARGRAAGFVEYMTKPLDVRRVLDVMAELLVRSTDGSPG